MSDNYECGNSRGMSSFSAVGQLYGRVLIERGSDGTEFVVMEK